MKDPTTISPEEDEEQMIMRRLRNSCDELKRGFRWLDYRMQRVKHKAEQSKEQRENIELPEEKVSVRGEPIPFKVREKTSRTLRNSPTTRPTSPWTRSSSTGRTRRLEEEGGWSTRGSSSTTAPCTTSGQLSVIMNI